MFDSKSGLTNFTEINKKHIKREAIQSNSNSTISYSKQNVEKENKNKND
jgi:hypothetical protein